MANGLAGILGRSAPFIPQTGAIVEQTAGRVRAEQEAQRQRDEAERKRLETQRNIDIISGVEPTTPAPETPLQEQPSFLESILEIAPDVIGNVKQVLAGGNPLDVENLREQTKVNVDLANKVAKAPDFAAKQNVIATEGKKAATNGADPEMFIELQNKSPDELDNAILRAQVTGKQVLKELPKPASFLQTPEQKAAFGRLAASNPQAAQALVSAEKLRTEQGKAQETFTPVLNDRGQVVGQRSSKTNLVASSPRAQARLAELKAGKAPASERKIADIMAANPGITRAQASNVATGVTQIVSDPLTGQPSLVNRATGAQAPVGRGTTSPIAPVQGTPAIQPQAQAPAQPAQGALTPAPAQAAPEQPKTVFDSLGLATGLVPNVQAFLSGPGGQISDDLVAEDVIRARTKVRGLRDKLITALGQGSKVSVQEQSRILENLPSLGVFESPGQARAQLTELHSILSRRVIADTEIMNDPTQSPKERQEANRRVNGVGAILEEIGQPPASGGGPTTISTQQQFDALPSGAEYIDAQTGRRAVKR